MMSKSLWHSRWRLQTVRCMWVKDCSPYSSQPTTKRKNTGFCQEKQYYISINIEKRNITKEKRNVTYTKRNVTGMLRHFPRVFELLHYMLKAQQKRNST